MNKHNILLELKGLQKAEGYVCTRLLENILAEKTLEESKEVVVKDNSRIRVLVQSKMKRSKIRNWRTKMRIRKSRNFPAGVSFSKKKHSQS